MMTAKNIFRCLKDQAVGPIVAEKEAGQVGVATVGHTDTVAMEMDVVHVPEKCLKFLRHDLKKTHLRVTKIKDF